MNVELPPIYDHLQDDLGTKIFVAGSRHALYQAVDSCGQIGVQRRDPMRSCRDVLREKCEKRFHSGIAFVSGSCVCRDEQTTRRENIGRHLAIELGVALEKSAFEAKTRGIARL